MEKTLEQLLRTTINIATDNIGGIDVVPTHLVKVQQENVNKGVHFIIHPDGYNGYTLDFWVKGNCLTQV